MGPARLETRDLGMRFEGLQALADVSMVVPAGQIRGLIGPNGAGKTTLFNCLSGFYRPTSGDVLLDSERIDGMAPHDLSCLGVSRTFQNIRLFANMTVVENVLIAGQAHHGVFQERTPVRRASRPGAGLGPLRLVKAPAWAAAAAVVRGAPALGVAAWGSVREIAGAVARPPAMRKDEREALDRSRALLQAVGLRGRENVVARNLPYGDQRRLEIARALATVPRVLLLDEPTAGMNPQESAAMVGLIRRIRDEYGTTVVLIEHQMRVVMGVCEQITVLDYGRKIAEGSPAEVQRDARVVEAYLGTRALGGDRGTP